MFQIISYLSLKDLLRCHRVSRQWKAILTSDPTPYQILDLRKERPLTKENVDALLDYSKNNIRTLQVHSLEGVFPFYAIDFGYRKNPYFKTHAHQSIPLLFNKLEELEITAGDRFPFKDFKESHNLRRLTVPNLNLLEVLQLHEDHPQLESLDFIPFLDYMFDPIPKPIPQYPSLRVLKLRHPKGSDFGERFLEMYPALEEFHIEECRRGFLRIDLQSTTLKIISLNNSDTTTLQISSNELLSLELMYMRNLSSLQVPRECRLQALILVALPTLSSDYLVLFRNSISTLQCLVIQSPQFEASHIESFLQQAMSLQFVNISGVTNVNDRTLSLLHDKVYIQRIVISQCLNVTPAGVIELVKKLRPGNGGRLRDLHAGDIPVRRETMYWIRQCGVRFHTH
jgi:F-box-like